MNILKLLRQKYLEGKNISLYIEEQKYLFGSHKLSQSEAIALSYDLQAGTYVEEFLKNEKRCKSFSDFIADTIKEVGIFSHLRNSERPTTICDMGTGESTCFHRILEHFKFKYKISLNSYAMDLSLSRLAVAKKFIESRKTKINPPKLFVGNLSSIPLLDNSIDIVCTTGSIEPNRGMEAQIVNEITRVTSNYIVITEAIYETASEQQKARMDKYGYITKLKTEIENNPNLELVKEILVPLEYGSNPLHQYSIIIARKIKSNDTTSILSKEKYACPIGGDELLKYNHYLISRSGACYPVIDDIPILLAKNMIPFYHQSKSINI